MGDVLLEVDVGLDGVLGAVHVSLNGLRGVGLNGLRFALLEALLEPDVVLLALFDHAVTVMLLVDGTLVPPRPPKSYIG